MNMIVSEVGLGRRSKGAGGKDANRTREASESEQSFVIVTRTYNLVLADVAEQSGSHCEPWSRLYGACPPREPILVEPVKGGPKEVAARLLDSESL